jgi:hypothetical protein
MNLMDPLPGIIPSAATIVLRPGTAPQAGSLDAHHQHTANLKNFLEEGFYDPYAPE